VRAYVEQVKRQGGTLTVTLAEGQPIKAHRVVVAIGRSGNYRKLDVPGEDLDKVYNRLHDPKDYAGKRVLVVGGGDTAMETAIALAGSGAQVTLSYRKAEFSRPKPENVEQLRALSADSQKSLTVLMSSNVKAIRDDAVDIAHDGQTKSLPNDVVFTMIGREAPLDFLRKSGIHVSGDHNAKWWATLVVMLLVFTFLYQWKKPGTFLPIAEFFEQRNWFPHNLGPWLTSLSDAFANPANILGTFALSAAGSPGKTGSSPGFWFSVMYTLLIVTFGIRRIRRRRTPYITWQTTALMAFQVVPLFLLPYILLPWMGHNGVFDSGVMKSVADHLFPVVEYDPHGREYWRAFGLILAWPLFLWNVFTSQPMWAWLIISLVQTFVIIPGIVFFWGKGAYCGWICSCGAMAETLGDTHRHKMPHGPVWNRMNMIGQVFLGAAMLLLVLRVISWMSPGGAAEHVYGGTLNTSKYGGYLPVLNYAWFVDLFWAGILGFGLYFNFSGRVWCRFACPLAALMHIYARFSRFRILADKKKCISCNVCTTVCHQGIDVMSFANKGKPMADPQCVRCSACVQSCPTGVLSFGQINRKTGAVIREDPAWLAASPVRMTEVTINGKRR
jgi:ferredoxin